MPLSENLHSRRDPWFSGETILNVLRMYDNIWFAKDLPWSETRRFGGPNWNTTFWSKTSAQLTASIDLKGHATIYLVCTHVATNKYFDPSVAGKRCFISTWISWKGQYSVNMRGWNTCSLSLAWGILHCRHISQLLM